MKKLVSIFMILALVIATTIAPYVSHAMPHDSVKSDGGDCHHGAAKTPEKTAQNDKNTSGKCCDKGNCKCVGGTCHNGLSKIFGNGSESLFRLTASKSSFGYTNDVVESVPSNRLKRPPKA